MLKMIYNLPMLTNPVRYGGSPDDSFDVIVPSLPGFGFSGYLKNSEMNNFHISELWAQQNLNIVRWTTMPQGGHFTAMEEPELFVENIRTFSEGSETGNYLPAARIYLEIL